MADSRVPAVIDALVTLFGAAPALDGVKVVDGPIVTGNPLREAVYIGYDGDPLGDGLAAEFSRAWAGLGQRTQDEQITVTCAVGVWGGSAKVRPMRVRAYEVLAAVDDVVRADPSLGLAWTPTLAQVVTGQLVYAQGSDGMECRIPFTVAVQTRI